MYWTESNLPHKSITLPRSEIYNLVRTKPVTELAKDFGIFDVALAKRCRALNIPLPSRGHWAKVAAESPACHALTVDL